MTAPPNLPLRQAVRRSFERAAATYDEHAFLQREIADRMLERLQYIRLAPSRTLDLGCGTGYLTAKLAARDPQAQLLALDLAPSMLNHTRQRLASPGWPGWPGWLGKLLGAAPTHHAICADAQLLPLAGESIDLAVSNLTLQWCDPEKIAREMVRVIRPGGLFMFTSLGPDTLKELRAAFRAVDDKPHVNTFVDMHDIGDMLVAAGFADPVMDCEIMTVTYTELMTLMRELKGIGAHNVLPERARGLTGKTRWAQLAAAYEKFRVDGRLPATYEVIYGHAWRPEVSKRKTVDGQQAISLGEFKRMVGRP